MPQYNHCIISLNGVSSEIQDLSSVKQNICYALRAADLSFEFHAPHDRGFISLEMELNQPNTLYILNDSLSYHLCQQPCILLTRSWPWVESNPKPNCIGVLTHEMIAWDYGELIGIICRNTPVRQHHDQCASHSYILFNQFFPERSDDMGRYAGAQVNWATIRVKDIHVRYLPYASDGLPFVSDMLREGLANLDHQDDILIMVNSDICLSSEAVGIIRAFMDSRDINCCYANRVDVPFGQHPSFEDIQRIEKSTGIDLFAFRPSSMEAEGLTKVQLYLGREGWDSAWASVVKHKLPWNICYHWIHDSEWKRDDAKNVFNREQIRLNFNVQSFPIKGVGVGYEESF